jgi:8-oxo-dGTP diphosphatase
MTRQRAAAIIIQDKKILLVRDAKADFFSMPGGSLEEGEDQVTALTRELKEELNVGVKEMKWYHSFDLMNQVYLVPQTDHAYLVEIQGEPMCSAEICELRWATQEDIVSGKVKVPVAFYENIFPKLVNEKIL